MKKIYINGKLCVGPTFSQTELLLIKRNLAQQETLHALAEMLSVVGNPQRLNILYLLHGHREMCVCDLAEVLEITDSAVSQHLRRLKDKKLVTARRKGQTIFYSLVERTLIKTLSEMFSAKEAIEQIVFH